MFDFYNELDPASRQMFMMGLGGRLLQGSQYQRGQNPWGGLGGAILGGMGDYAQIRDNAANAHTRKLQNELAQMQLDEARAQRDEKRQTQKDMADLWSKYMGTPPEIPYPARISKGEFEKTPEFIDRAMSAGFARSDINNGAVGPGIPSLTYRSQAPLMTRPAEDAAPLFPGLQPANPEAYAQGVQALALKRAALGGDPADVAKLLAPQKAGWGDIPSELLKENVMPVDPRDPTKGVMPIPGAQPKGAWEGSAMDAQAYRIIADYEQKKANNLPVNANETFNYEIAKRHVMTPKIVGSPETGFTATTPPPLPTYGGAPQAAPAPTVAPISGPAKPLAGADIERLTDAAGTAQSFVNLNAKFKDGYGGYKFETLGDAANWTTRNLGYGDKDRADWWQTYQDQKNLIRNKLFGSALTLTERSEFDKAQINPGMTDSQIRMNLARQSAAADKALKKLSSIYSESGYNKAAIEKATAIESPSAGQINIDDLVNKYRSR